MIARSRLQPRRLSAGVVADYDTLHVCMTAPQITIEVREQQLHDYKDSGIWVKLRCKTNFGSGDTGLTKPLPATRLLHALPATTVSGARSGPQHTMPGRASTRCLTALGLSCETPAASGPLGLHTTTRELQTYTFERPANTTKIPREDHQRGKKNTNFVAGEGKKSAKFCSPNPSGPTLRAPNLRGPIFSGLGPYPSGRS